MNSFAAEFHRKLQNRLTEALAETEHSIVSGRLETIEDYRLCTGRRQALCDAIQMCDEVAKEIADLTRM